MQTNPLSNLSYTNKDFTSVYVELLDLVKQLSSKWDPSVSNESDPGVILLKADAIIADKNNYNIDKNVLEMFPETVTQEMNARNLYKQLAYIMPWYKSASTSFTFKWIGRALENGETVTIPQYTMLTNEDGSAVYTLTEELVIDNDHHVVVGDGMEGVFQTLSVNGSQVISITHLDSDNRVYLPESAVAENGIFIRSVDNSKLWERVDNLQVKPRGNTYFEFGIDSRNSTCYLEFPEDVDKLIGNGLSINYLTSQGSAGNVSAGCIDRFYSDVTVNVGSDSMLLNSDIINLYNASASKNGSDPETIEEAYRNYRKIAGTFNTLVTLRDYVNAVYNSGLVSNVIVSDRLNDIQHAYQIRTSDTVNPYVTQLTHSDECVSYFKAVCADVGETDWYIYNADTGAMTQHTSEDADRGSYLYKKYHNGDTSMNAFDLKLYLFDTPHIIDSITDYEKTFDLIPSESVQTEEIKRYIYNQQCVQHNFRNIVSNLPCLFKNVFPIGLKVVPQHFLTSIQIDQVKSNIVKALWNTCNSRVVEFGELPSYDVIYDAIVNCDERIKIAVLDDFTYTTFATYWDEDEEEFKDIPISSTDSKLVVQCNCAEDVSPSSHYLKDWSKAQLKRTYFLWGNDVYRYNPIENDFDLYSSLRTNIQKEIIAKSVIGGRTPLFKNASAFTYKVNQQYESELSASRITTGAVISPFAVPPDKDDPTKSVPIKTTFNSNGDNIDIPEPQINNALLEASYTLKDNESIRFLAPTFKSTVNYSNYAKFQLILNENTGKTKNVVDWSEAINNNTVYEVNSDDYNNAIYDYISKGLFSFGSVDDNTKCELDSLSFPAEVRIYIKNKAYCIADTGDIVAAPTNTYQADNTKWILDTEFEEHTTGAKPESVAGCYYYNESSKKFCPFDSNDALNSATKWFTPVPDKWTLYNVGTNKYLISKNSSICTLGLSGQTYESAEGSKEYLPYYTVTTAVIDTRQNILTRAILRQNIITWLRNNKEWWRAFTDANGQDTDALTDTQIFNWIVANVNTDYKKFLSTQLQTTFNNVDPESSNTYKYEVQSPFWSFGKVAMPVSTVQKPSWSPLNKAPHYQMQCQAPEVSIKPGKEQANTVRSASEVVDTSLKAANHWVTEDNVSAVFIADNVTYTNFDNLPICEYNKDKKCYETIGADSVTAYPYIYGLFQGPSSWLNVCYKKERIVVGTSSEPNSEYVGTDAIIHTTWKDDHIILYKEQILYQVPANGDYQLQVGDVAVFFWRTEDADDAPYHYKKYVGISSSDATATVQSPIIKPSFVVNGCSLTDAPINPASLNDEGVLLPGDTLYKAVYAMYGDFDLSGTKSIEIRDLKQTVLDNGKNNYYLITNTISNENNYEMNLLSQQELSEFEKVLDGTRTSIVGNYRYTLQSDEYFVRTNKTFTEYEIFHPGTMIGVSVQWDTATLTAHCKDKTTTNSQLSRTYMLSVPAIPYETIMAEGISSFSQSCKSISNIETLYAREQQVHNIVKGNTLQIRRNTTHTEDPVPVFKSWEDTYIGAEFEVSYKTLTGEVVTLPSINIQSEQYGWSARATLNINSSSDAPQCIEPLSDDYKSVQLLAVHREDVDEIECFPQYEFNNSNQLINADNIDDIYMQSDVCVNRIGGNNIDITYVDLLADRQDVNLYFYTESILTASECFAVRLEDKKVVCDISKMAVEAGQRVGSLQLNLKPSSNYMLCLDNMSTTINVTATLSQVGTPSVPIAITKLNRRNCGGKLYYTFATPSVEDVCSCIITLNASTAETTNSDIVVFDSLSRFTYNDFSKYNFSAENILTAVQGLDIDDVYNYAFTIDSNDEMYIEDPLNSKSFFNEHHIANAYTISKADLNVGSAQDSYIMIVNNR